MSKITIFLAAAAVVAIAPCANAQEGDAEAGSKVFKKCAVCHNIETDKKKVGPSLQGVIGRQPGTREGYSYSKAMIAFGEGKVWDEALLTEYLAKPRDVVKGTKMAFAGLKKDEDIANVIAYIQQFSPAQ